MWTRIVENRCLGKFHIVSHPLPQPQHPHKAKLRKKIDKKFMNCVNNVQRNKYKTYPTIEWLYYGWGGMREI